MGTAEWLPTNGGGMGARMRDHDWTTTPLGAPPTWPQPLRTIVDVMLASGQPMFVAWGPERILLYNDAYAPLMGDRHPAGLGRPFFDVWPDIVDACVPLFARVFAGEPVFMEDIELRPVRMGRPVEEHYAFSYTPVRDEAGTVAGLFCVCNEITGHVLGQRASEQNTRLRYETALRVARLGTYDWQPSTGLIDIDARGREMFGMPAEGILTQEDTFACLAREDVERVQAEASVAMGIGHPFDPGNLGRIHDYGYDIVRTDGSRRSILSSGAIIENPDGTRRMVGTFNDITAVVASIRQQAAIFNSAVDFAIVATDRDGRVTDWNVGAERLLGWAADEMLGETVERIFTPEDRTIDRATTEMRLALADGRASDRRWHLRRDGSRFWANGEMMPLRDEREAHIGFLKILQDRTTEHLAGVALREGEARRLARLELSDRLAAHDGDTAGLVQVACDVLGRTLGVKLVGYGLVEPEAETITVERDWVSDGARTLAGTLGFRSFGSYVDDLKRGETVVVADCRTDPRTQASADALGARSARAFVNAPVFEQGRFTALLYVSTDVPRTWSEEELQFIHEVAERTCNATARRQAETQLRDSEERYRTLFDSIDQGFCIIRFLDGPHGPFGDYVHVEANPAFGHHLGIPHVAGQTARDIIPEGEIEGWLGIYGEVLRTGQPVHFEREFVPTNRYLEVAAHRLEPPSRREVAVLFTDITERKRSEVALRTSEAVARENIERVQLALAAGAIIGTWFWDLPSDRFTVDEAFARAFGLDPALGRDGIPLAQIVATVHPDDQAGLAEAINSAIARGGPYAHQYRTKRADGRYYWLEANGHVEHAADGTPLSFPGVLLDVEERRAVEAERARAVAALRELNADLERQVTERALARGRTWQLSPDIMGVLNEDGYFTQSNPAWASVLGWSEAEVARTVFFDFIHPDDLQPARAAWAAANARGVPAINFENRYRHKDGTWRWLSWVAVPDAGKVYCSARDITATKEQSSALMQAEEALRQSQKMEAVGQLTGGVAHDFNNLLTIIRSSVDFLRRPDLPDARKQRYLDAVSETVDRAAKLTKQLLAFARRQALTPEVFDVGARLRGVGDMLDTVTGARIRVVIEVPEDPCFVRADLSQFETALVNMAVNARDAMDGEGRLTLRLQCTAPMPQIRGHASSTSDFSAVSVTDTGTGIAPDQIGRIFEPFFTTKEVGKGTGLGLSQVFGFAKQSGGDVDVRSVLGEGTTFTLYLPEVRVEQLGTTADNDDHVQGSVGTGQRVLVVEDNIEVGQFCTQILDDLGYVTVWAANAEEALAKLGDDGDGFDAVFSDVVMPGMGGVALAEILRRKLPGLPVVLASGYSHVLAREADHGFELLHKPYSAEQLGGVLQKAMAKASANQPRRARS